MIKREGRRFAVLFFTRQRYRMSVKQAFSSDSFSRSAEKGAEKFWWKGLILLLAIGLALRIVVALVSDNIHFPDEIFQLLEQAHRVVFGYGFVPWEFSHGTRSWIVPGFLAGILSGCKALQLDYPNAYIPIVKICLCVISTSLIYFSYVMARALSSEQAGRMAAFFTCFWYELVYFAHKPLTSILATYLFIGALACAVDRRRLRPALLGLMAALAVAIRIQLAPVVGLLALFLLFRWNKKKFFAAGTAFVLVIIIAGLIDYWTWGSLFISYYNNVLYNIVYEVAAQFGTRPAYWYFHALFLSSMGLFSIVIIWGLIHPSKAWFLMACTGVILLVHSFLGHKEYRFVFTVIPVLLNVLAVLLSETILARASVKWRKPFLVAIAVCFVGLSAAGLFNRLPQQKKVYRYAAPLSEKAYFIAYRLLSEKNDIVAIYDTTSHWAFSGGYYYLHRDVPLYFRIPRNGPMALDTRRAPQYVSHVIKTGQRRPIPVFKEVVGTFGRLDIVKQDRPRHKYWENRSYTREITNKNLDDKYKPQVKRRF